MSQAAMPRELQHEQILQNMTTGPNPLATTICTAQVIAAQSATGTEKHQAGLIVHYKRSLIFMPFSGNLCRSAALHAQIPHVPI